jgi:hypothetical protein
MIETAAIYLNGKVFTVPRPGRHCDVRALMARKSVDCGMSDGEPGFMDDAGRFLRRKAAATHAVKAGQVKREAVNWNLGLFTEDLW